MYTFVHFYASLLSNEMHKKPLFLFLAWVNTNLNIWTLEQEIDSFSTKVFTCSACMSCWLRELITSALDTAISFGKDI